MAIGKTPVNQLNALPLQDADSNAAGGTLQVVGGTITRYFSPAVLGINGASFTPDTLNCTIVSPFLDLRGCSKYTVALRLPRVTAGGLGQITNVFCHFQTRMGASDTPILYNINGGGQLDLVGSGWIAFNNNAQLFDTASNGTVQTVVWSLSESGPSDGRSTSLVLGSDVRLIFATHTATAGSPNASNLFSAQLWASS